jgi:uncharacterized protein YdeI (YjbR/CyaY-like superfamily)
LVVDEVPFPEDLHVALARLPGATEAFAEFAHDDQRAFVAFIEDAVGLEHRAARIEMLVKVLRSSGAAGGPS